MRDGGIKVMKVGSVMANLPTREDGIAKKTGRRKRAAGNALCVFLIQILLPPHLACLLVLHRSLTENLKKPRFSVCLQAKLDE